MVGVVCFGVGAGFYIAAAMYAASPAPPAVLGLRPSASDSIKELLPLIGKSLEKKEAVRVAAAPSVSGTSTVFIAGDIMLGRDVAKLIKTNGADYPFAQTKGVIASADAAIANLEGPLTDRNAAPNDNMRFHFDPGLGAALAGAGFDAVSLANNHGLDQGSDGRLDTKKNLDAAGIKYFGDPQAADGGAYFFNAGGRRFAVLGFQLVYGVPDVAGYAQAIAAAKKNADYVIVMPHWGVEYKHDADAAQKELAHGFIDAGADLVVGSHPHVVEGIESYKGKAIFYSLGNFVFDQYFSADTQNGLALRLNIDPQKQVSVELLPYEIPHSQAVFTAGDAKAKLLENIAAWSSADLKNEITAGLLK